MTTTSLAELRQVSGGFDPSRGNWVHRGLDLSKPTEITQAEVDAFKSHYKTQFGLALDGLDWWLDNNPETLKRYRLYCSLTLRVQPAVMGGGTLAFYMLMGYVQGARYCMHSLLNEGLSKAQALEMIAIAFVHAGPRGMETIEEAMRDLEFPETTEFPARFPPGWGPDLEAFRSGLDFSSIDLSAREEGLLFDWYLRTIGEVPPYVRFLARHRPRLLKAHRARMENMVYVLPKQVWPTALLFYNVMTRTAEGIRENVLLSKAWGVAKSDVLDLIGNSLVYGQMEGAAMVQREVGDVLDSWS